MRLIRVPGDHNPLPFGIVACTVFPTTFLEIAVIQLSKGHSRPLLNMPLIIIVINKSTSFQFFSRSSAVQGVVNYKDTGKAVLTGHVETQIMQTVDCRLQTVQTVQTECNFFLLVP